MSRDERLHSLIIRMHRRWMGVSPLVDRVRWARWIGAMS